MDADRFNLLTLQNINHHSFIGLAVGPKVGIVVGILIIVALLVFIACLKLKFFPREHRLKLKPVSISSSSQRVFY